MTNQIVSVVTQVCRRLASGVLLKEGLYLITEMAVALLAGSSSLPFSFLCLHSFCKSCVRCPLRPPFPKSISTHGFFHCGWQAGRTLADDDLQLSPFYSFPLDNLCRKIFHIVHMDFKALQYSSSLALLMVRTMQPHIAR